MGARPCLLGAVEATSDDRGRGSTLGVVAADLAFFAASSGLAAGLFFAAGSSGRDEAAAGGSPLAGSLAQCSLRVFVKS